MTGHEQKFSLAPFPRHMDMRMFAQRASPGVQCTEQTYLGPEVFFIGQQLLQRFSGRFEQMIAAPFAVVLPQRIEFMRQGEDDMIMIAGEQARFGSLQPIIGHGPVTTRATAVTTGVMLLLDMAISQADPFFIAERFTSAQHDRLRRAHLIGTHAVPLMIGSESVSEDALQGRFHLIRPAFLISAWSRRLMSETAG
jgi:hypothetical protein